MSRNPRLHFVAIAALLLAVEIATDLTNRNANAALFWNDPRTPNPTARILDVIDGLTVILSVVDPTTEKRIVGRVRMIHAQIGRPGKPLPCDNYDAYKSPRAIAFVKKLLKDGYVVSHIGWEFTPRPRPAEAWIVPAGYLFPIPNILYEAGYYCPKLK